MHTPGASQRLRMTGISLGNKAVKSAAVVSADDDLFTVYGLCYISLMYGEVTTIIGGTATVALNEKTSSIPIAKATTIDNDAVGTLYLVSGQPEAALNGLGTPTIKVATLTCEHDTAADRSPAHSPIIINGGASGVTIESTATGSRTGAIEWTIFFFPLESGARIVAAA